MAPFYALRYILLSLSYSETLSSLDQIDPAALTFTRGIEKEGLRIQPDSQISQQGHQAALGSALTHSSITTDYSEALLEFITPVKGSAAEVLDFLKQAHQFTQANIQDELIWPASMPGVINDELDVPIAQFGSSNVGQLKHVYRHGLWHRYGRKMQCIAGLHYNYSVSEELWAHLAKANGQTCDKDFISQGYFGLIRNFRRYSWLLLYLFGASPAVDKSFVQDKEHELEKWDDDTFYLPYATSLRMSGLGYQNNAQEDLFVCFNGLPTYTTTLKEAMATSVPAYENIGVEKAGVYNQLNTNLLQIENEYYSDVRPKRNSKNGEKPLTALNEHGVEYIEVRCLDLNPFLPLGLDKQQSEFMDLFLAYCLLHPSPDLSSAECKEVAQNQHDVVLEGRKPGFELKQLGESVSLKAWAETLLLDMAKLATVLDAKQHDSKPEDGVYQSSLNAMMVRVKDVNQTPSAKMLGEMKDNSWSFAEFGLNQAKVLAKTHKQALSSDLASEWSAKSEKSLKKQQDIESLEEPVFADFLSEYLQAP